MSPSPQGLMMVLAIVGAAALTLPEALAVWHLRHVRTSLLMRRTVLRAVTLGLLGVGLVELVSCAGGLVWLDLDRFLQRRLTVPTVATLNWLGAWLRIVLGLLLACRTLTPEAGAALGTVLAFGASLSWWVVVRLMPLQPGRATWLLGLALAIVLPALVLIGISRWRESPAQELPRPLRHGLGACAALLVFTPLVVGDGGWCGALLGAALASFAAWLLLSCGRVSLDREFHGTHRAHLLMQGLLDQRRAAWVTLAALGCVLQWAVLAIGAPAVSGRGVTVMESFAAWPQVLTNRDEPSPAEWEQLVAHLTDTTNQYRGHRWCGRYLLLIGWIEATRLHHEYRARLILGEAAATYPRSRADAPPGWPKGRNVRAIVQQLLVDWGPLMDPGSRPS
jgi:hypothetical protein